ncbi:Dam family site-specific DNA-(adenine-N6)-methyltransferase [Halorarum halophilum]|uniref:site-specific DNA-methyltransferase (adenine-specific) n=1 Tax=Halorarum halophilum TaxID=2743090 RepID=A0A7D5K0G9_9EURY|nr:Dam family site-specific DNA-(adenine-N6)-methyltransferase [Halobaculum halophilum]QLG26861.1 Dam family site-specific DNA-(adenine-N6)-methyltransferase [Halobaculum halophilum]
MAKPVLKWAGGKRQILHKLRACISQDYDAYHEPFFGGGALFFDLEPGNGSINDINPRLMNFYSILQSEDWRDMVEEAKELEENHSEEFYYECRDEFNRLRNQRGQMRYDERVKEAALLLYLNRTCFNGLYRENQSGEFNVPIGSYSNPDIVHPDQLQEAHDALQGIDIMNKDYRYIGHEAEAEDLVYFDPPYQKGSGENFAEYFSDTFDVDDQIELLHLVLDLHEQGVEVAMSNSGAAERLYKKEDRYQEYIENEDLFVVPLEARRSINSDGENRTGADEIILTSVPEQKRKESLSSY